MPFEYLVPLLILSGLLVDIVVNAIRENRRIVPMAVAESFYRQYPNAREVRFEREGKGRETVVEVEFESGGVNAEATYAKNGRLLELEQDISPGELPADVLEALHRNYPGAKLKDAERIVRGDGTIRYEVEIRQELEILLDEFGQVLKVEAD